MADPGNVQDLFDSLEKQAEVMERLKMRGGGGTSGGMDGWQTSVEKRLDGLTSSLVGLDGRLRAVEIGLATLNERVAHLPGKGFIVTSSLGVVTFMTAALVFADKIKGIVGLTH